MAEAWINVEGVGQVLAQHNNGQGDCLFVAISQQLEGQITSLELRHLAVTYLTEHAMEFEDELLSLGWDMVENGEIPNGPEGQILVDAVLQTLSNPQTWGGAECIAALSLALNREIRVYQEDGPTIVFPRGENLVLRIVLRYPRPVGARRTHYESVLHWRAESPAPVVQVSRDAQTQTNGIDGSSEAAEAEDFNPQEGRSCEAEPQSRPPSRNNMVLRPRHPDCPPINLQSEEFSDAEEYDSAGNTDLSENFRRCKYCRHNVGRYALMNCGAFPVCGTCIRTWYVNIKGAPCAHCGGRVAGWIKVFNQN